MPQFMIELTHDPEECIEALEEHEPRASDLLDEVYWGCVSGRHSGWVVVEADDESQARNMVPESLRDRAKVTPVELATPELAEAVDMEAANPTLEKPST